MTDQKGFSLVEVLIACTLGLLLLCALGLLVQQILNNNRHQQQYLTLQQRLWQIEHHTLETLEHAGFSAIYPADDAEWQNLSDHTSLHLYQVGSETLPEVLSSHWATKLLPHSTVIETQALESAQWVQTQPDRDHIQITTNTSIKADVPWLLVSPDKWQQLKLCDVQRHLELTTLHFNADINTGLQLPYMAGPYQHELWFVARNGEHEPDGSPQYGLYRWDLTTNGTAHEVVSGVTQWRGNIVAQQAGLKPWVDKTRCLIHWQLTLQDGIQQSEEFYALNIQSTQHS